MNFNELLIMRGFDITKRIKIIRHKDPVYNIERLYSEGMLETFQSIQSKDIFGGCDYIISFVAKESTTCVFVGVYEVIGKESVLNYEAPREFLYPELFEKDDFYYNLKPCKILDDLKDRVVIDWGKATISWHQWLSEKEVIEILAIGQYKRFPGYLNFKISFYELKTIIDNPEANKEWHVMLKAVAGVYLILDTQDGNQYIGSAYGKEGILGRWKEYSISKHGNNKRLIELLDEFPDRYKNFQYTILQTLPTTLTNREVIEFESLYKDKLGTRAFGLNLN